MRWFYDITHTNPPEFAIVDEDGCTICNPSPMGAADAALIACAPYLLTTLRAVVQLLEREGPAGIEAARAIARAAISRATYTPEIEQ